MDLSSLQGLLSSPMMGIANGLLSSAGPSMSPQSPGMLAGSGVLQALQRQKMMQMLQNRMPQVPGLPQAAGFGIHLPIGMSLAGMGGGTGLIPGSGLGLQWK